MDKYFNDNRLEITGKLLFYLHSQLKVKTLEFTSNKYDSIDCISEYLESYFKNEFKEKYTSLFHLFNSSGIGLSAANVERALKGKKGKQIVNKNVEVSYMLLDLMSYASWGISLLEVILDQKNNWEDITIYSVEVPKYIQDLHDEIKKPESTSTPKNENEPSSKINDEDKNDLPKGKFRKIMEWIFVKHRLKAISVIILGVLGIGIKFTMCNHNSNNKTNQETYQHVEEVDKVNQSKIENNGGIVVGIQKGQIINQPKEVFITKDSIQTLTK